jgi:uncharacterized protein YbjT (DUF2867 family)
LAALAKRGVAAVCVARSGEDADRVADLAVPQDVERALDGVDAVVHTASSPRGEQSTETLYIRNVTDAVKRSGAHVVYVSIVNVDRIRFFPYYRAKHDAETLLAASGVAYTIQRAAQFHPFLDYIFRILARPPIAVLPPWSVFQPVDVDAVAEHLAGLATGAPLGMARDVVGPETRSGADLFALWSRAVQRHKPAIELPLPIAGFRAFANGRLVNEAAERIGPSFESWLGANLGRENPYVVAQRR